MSAGYELVIRTADGRVEPLVDNFARHVLGGAPVPGPPGRARLGIRCNACGLVSWNVSDVERRYCGRCHTFHDDAGP